MNDKFDLNNISIKKLISDRETFNEFVYTPAIDAVRELKNRQSDVELEKKVKEMLKGEIPSPLKEKPKLVLFRQLFTPNYELRRFMVAPDALGVDPIFWEYYDDKFTSNNPVKYSWGKLHFYKGVGKKGGAIIHRKNIIDFNKSNGKRIKDVVTTFGGTLIDLHHNLLQRAFPGSEKYLYDASEWFSKNRGTAKEYYKSFTTLFIRHAILFENFVLNGEDREFTEQVFLPAFIDVWRETHKKPLVVALEPTDIEGDIFWMCHPWGTSEETN